MGNGAAYVLAVKAAVVVDGDGVLVERLHIRRGLALARMVDRKYYTPDGAGRGLLGMTVEGNVMP